MANRDGHRRFGNARKLPSGRYQIRYPGPDGRIRTGPETYERKGDADKALVLIEAQLSSGDWTDPDRGKVKLGVYASKWITERPGLRIRTMDLYRWLLRKHIEPYLGGVPIARLSPQMIREWRAALVNGGVSVSVTAKAYRLLRAVMMTAVEEDKILPRNPCQIRNAGTEDAAERPVLTVAQVFALAEEVGRRPVGNIRAVPDGYRLRFRRGGEMRTAPEVYATRPEAERTLWTMAGDCRADCTQDRRFYALVLLATFSSLRWGEVTALRRRDLDLDARTVRIRAAYIERSTGEMLLGPPKSQAGRRIVGIPDAIVPALRAHLAAFVQDEPGALVFPGRQRWPDQAGQLQQDVRLAARRRVHRHAGAALPRPPAHREPVRGGERRRASRPDGPDGTRQRAGRDDLPARGPRRRPAHYGRHRRPRPGAAQRRRR
jgi:integrase